MKALPIFTEVNTVPANWKINLGTGILTIGSCFADVIGSQLSENKFRVMNNPFGTVFNPLAIIKILDSALGNKVPDQSLYIETQDKIWLHHDFHSSLWSTTRASLDAEISGRFRETGDFLRSAKVLVITLGTAYAYRHRAVNQLIGNCHKVPAERFLKELLHPDQILIPFEQLVFKLLSVNRDLKIILTVSPVRHTRDTLPLNQVSKSTLRLVCHRLSEKFRHIEYFPAYEIMVDELRDYRYYKEDLIHPNKLAEDHIFRTFTKTYLDIEVQRFIQEWESIRQMLDHRPQYGNTPSQYKLLLSIKQKLVSISADADVSREIAEVNRRIEEFPVSG
ncbi:hypothetical protein DYBT9275_03263 [Dyadobacter sp. CECT 9275]|uniref:GSCFA domain-containing protein n=1 Tax=Dyadobacter helix TaxID=2822344 RepID=A0A916N583_9BACT|nr:GSCFA domain-containing protein [Dyadobacter sp. CECT 9275]CAG5003942.1 hypothetical protein DYBT9275_03263 [Dyadobacter sp. CECT 9275]